MWMDRWGETGYHSFDFVAVLQSQRADKPRRVNCSWRRPSIVGQQTGPDIMCWGQPGLGTERDTELDGLSRCWTGALSKDGGRTRRWEEGGNRGTTFITASKQAPD